jgi:hypothetical protein
MYRQPMSEISGGSESLCRWNFCGTKDIYEMIRDYSLLDAGGKLEAKFAGC